MNNWPSNLPARFSITWLVPPRIGVRWQEPHPSALKIGPRPSASVSGPVNSSAAVSKLHSTAGIVGELGEFTRLAWFAQNSLAKPLDASVNPVGASRTVWDSTGIGSTIAAASSTTPTDAMARKDRTSLITHLLRKPS